MTKNLSRLIITVALFAAITGCSGDPVESSFEETVSKYWTALEQKDFRKAASYLPQAKISRFGMKEVENGLADAFADLPIKKWQINKIQMHHDHDDTYFGVASVTFETDGGADSKNQVNGATYLVEVSSIGHTDSKGKTWHFVDSEPEDIKFLGTMGTDIYIIYSIFQALRYTYRKMPNGKLFRRRSHDRSSDHYGVG